MDYLWQAFTVSLGANLFQKSSAIGGAVPPPIETYFLLLESGDNFITESGDFLVIEEAP